MESIKIAKRVYFGEYVRTFGYRKGASKIEELERDFQRRGKNEEYLACFIRIVWYYMVTLKRN